MMTIWRRITALCWVAVALPLAAQGPAADSPATEEPAAQVADAELAERIERWVSQLDAAQLQRRREAEAALLEIGPEALPHLPSDLAALPAESRSRLQRIRQQLQLIQAERFTGPTPVDLLGESTIEDALYAIAEQTGIEFEMERAPQVELPRSRATTADFWPALDGVLDAAQLDVNLYGGGRDRLMLIPRPDGRPPRSDAAAYAGLYRLEPRSISARRDFQRRQLDGMTVAVEIAWEPRLTPIGLTLPLQQLVATLDDGSTLEAGEGQLEVAASPELFFSEVNVPLSLPSRQAERIERLSGVLVSLLPSHRHAFQFDLAEPGDPQQEGGVTVRIENVRRHGELHEVRCLLQLDDPDRALESHRQWVFRNPAFVTRGDDQRVEHLGFQVYRQAGGEVGVGYLFDVGEDPAGAHFHYETPVAIVRTEVPFTIEGLALP
jgi:hypothetical protein